jgi:hypothetical protein
MFTCPRCGIVSHNPNDAANRYCGRCHVFFDDEAHALARLVYAKPDVSIEELAELSKRIDFP